MRVSTLQVTEAGALLALDQTRLPFEAVQIKLENETDCLVAIQSMQVRGAPLIGIVGAFGLAMAIRAGGAREAPAAFERLLASRPTAVNLRWALDRVTARVAGVDPGQVASAAWAEAVTILHEDIECNRSIGIHGLALLEPLLERARQQDRPLRLLTHCNAGALATAGWGTALAPMFLAHQRGERLQVWVDETRPRNQGAGLTAWELGQAGIAHTVIADNAGGLLMMQGQVDAVIVGTDRVTANGDVCNKIGTYLKALAAAAHQVPFYVACPISTIDSRLSCGSDVPIEYRDAREVSHMRGVDHRGVVTEIRIVPTGTGCLNPAFDITPAALVSALITERGVCAATTHALEDHLRMQ